MNAGAESHLQEPRGRDYLSDWILKDNHAEILDSHPISSTLHDKVEPCNGKRRIDFVCHRRISVIANVGTLCSKASDTSKTFIAP